MKRHHVVLSALVIVAVMCLLLGCASSPDMTADAPAQVKVRMVPERDLARHGVTFANDPLYAPLAFLHQKDEFVAFVVDLVLPRSARIVLAGDVKTEDGTVVARLYSSQELREYWKARVPSTDEDLPGRLDALERYYAPFLDFTARRGRREYYLVCIGKSPIPRPSTAELRVTIDTEQPQGFSFSLPKTK